MSTMAAPSQTRPMPPKAGTRSRRVRRRRLIVAGAVVAVLAGAGVAAALLVGGDDAPEAAPPVAAPTKDDAQNVADALSKLASRPQDLVASDINSSIAGKARQALAKSATVTADPASWHADGLGGGTITVTVRNGNETTVYTALMIKESTGWKVVGTVPMAKPPAGQQPAVKGAAPAPKLPTPPPPKNPPPAAPPLPGAPATAPTAGTR